MSNNIDHQKYKLLISTKDLRANLIIFFKKREIKKGKLL